MMSLFPIILSLILPHPTVFHTPIPPPSQLPGQIYKIQTSTEPPPPDAPIVYSYSKTAKSDESFVLVGENLGDSLYLWGPSAHSPNGQSWQVKVQYSSPDLLIATIPQEVLDGLFVVWPVKNGVAGYPVRINAPQPYWCSPDIAHPGDSVRVFGQCLARLPDERTAFVYICQQGKKGFWAEVEEADRYSVRFRLPRNLPPGDYKIWLNAGYGGDWGWGGPLDMKVIEREKPLSVRRFTSGDLQRFIDEVKAKGGGIVLLPEGEWELKEMLKIPQGVFLKGMGMEKTRLRITCSASNIQPFRLPRKGGWNEAVGGIHNVGDSLEYKLEIPEEGEWYIWMRYAAHNAPYQLSDMAGRTVLIANDGKPVPLLNLPDTDDWGRFSWSKVGKIRLKEGINHLRWVNEKGGGLNIDAFLFARNPHWSPPKEGFPKPSQEIVILQAEEAVSVNAKEAHIPSEGTAGIWLLGNNCGLADISLIGSELINIGIAVRSPEPNQWIDGIKIENVRVLDVGGKEGENCALYIHHAKHITVQGCDLTGGCPLYLSGVRQGQFIGNKLRGVSRVGPNSTGAIQGRTEPFSQCVIENNTFICPEGGGPTSARMVWISTGKGSVGDNYIAGNKAENPRFGDIAGTDQNVGEMILLESCMRYAYYGEPEGVDVYSITLPENAPYLPPAEESGEFEPPANEYYVVVLGGKGMGQVRRVTSRRERTFTIDRAWDVVPDKKAKILLTTLFARNLIIGNEVINGMSGLQLWIGGWENIFARNKIANQRRQGIFLFSATSTLEPQMTATWNAGIGVLLFNTVEYNWIENTSDGILLYSDNGGKPIEWPRAIGNVIRHNTMIKSRFNGINISGTLSEDKNPSILGTIAEFNFCRDQRTGISLNEAVRGAVVRRNLIYFWEAYLLDGKSIGLNFKGKGIVEESNNVEGPVGEENPQGVKRYGQ